MPMSEDELRQAIGEIEIYKGQLTNLARQEEILRVSLQEYLRARETLVRYKDMKEGNEILVPIGADTFIFAKSSDTKKAMIGIGSDVIIDKGIDDALKIVDDKIEELRNGSRNVAERMMKTEEAAQTLSLKIQEELARYEEGKRKK